jgi:hypothetical protein
MDKEKMDKANVDFMIFTPKGSAQENSAAGWGWPWNPCSKAKAQAAQCHGPAKVLRLCREPVQLSRKSPSRGYLACLRILGRKGLVKALCKSRPN